MGTPLPNCSGTDWIHMNAVTYNATLDQIMVSSRNLNEIYIIEHGTNTVLSAGHWVAGTAKGANVLYRWGNPQAYGRGGPGDQQLFGQHSPYWIHENSNKIMINNDGWHGTGPCPTSVDVIDLPEVNGVYSLGPKAPYGPARPAYAYKTPEKFWSCL